MSDSLRVLAIGGIDPCGGAGLTADARMIQARGGMPLTVPACLTVQNRYGLDVVEPVEPGLFEGMLAAAVEDGPLDACKLGLLGDALVAERVAEMLAPLRARGVPIVVDPVLGATAGGWCADPPLLAAYRRWLTPLAEVLTPNLDELRQLAPDGPAALLAAGCGAVLVTDGHGEGEAAEDRLWSPAGDAVFRHPRLDLGPVHGTGCALAAALACELAAGVALEHAVRAAVSTIHRCLRATSAGDGRVPVPLRIV